MGATDEELPQDERRPPLAHDLRRLGDGTIGAAYDPEVILENEFTVWSFVGR